MKSSKHDSQVVHAGRTKAGELIETDAVVMLETSPDASGNLKICKITEYCDSLHAEKPEFKQYNADVQAFATL